MTVTLTNEGMWFVSFVVLVGAIAGGLCFNHLVSQIKK